MFHIRGEGEMLRPGFNFYPWSQRRYSFGFVLVWGKKRLQVRVAHYIRRVYMGPIAFYYAPSWRVCD